MDRRSLLVSGFLFAAMPAAAEPINARGGLAIGGYDPVAYFREGRARRGAAAYSADWGGARWLFVSRANHAAFVAEPSRYVPRYGGYCAYGMANGYKASVDPEAWTIEDGVLYLNYSKSVRERWLAERAGFIARADANWPAVSGTR
ncbi:MAG: YHS domain protein [Alphaproteobacteria bacterium]|nr:YHS domain protein [Alphaproteobacteria bacterium]